MSESRYIQVITTAASKQDAERIARTLVDERLAACVQVAGPITSVYRWQGQVETAEEWQCLAKSRREWFARIAEAIRRVHAYQVPEILAFDVVDGSPDYLAWLDGQLLLPDQDGKT